MGRETAPFTVLSSGLNMGKTAVLNRVLTRRMDLDFTVNKIDEVYVDANHIVEYTNSSEAGEER